ncbi:MAG: Macrolide export ATP-binding/permease protein MacB [Parcubacteria group bacterium GW2011_GWC1_44_26]|nr:MAG: Macrolide export ATP-binding/permease protein MacB [Parcubacteria group bacterium GW2011_GWC1_44_26]
MSTPLVKLEGINFYYNRGKPSEVHALKDINLEIERGGYAAFFGPSGCGKTTLTYLIGGIETENADEGHILINGRDLRGLSKKELAVYRQIGVGIIFQQFNLLPSRRKEAMKLLDRFAMTKYAERFPSELSGGQQQRVSIARALANNPPLIIADEPLGNLDSENANRALEFLKELNEKDGRTIIMVTHESWSLRDARTIFYLKDGELIKKEQPEKKKEAQKKLSEHLYHNLFPEVTPERLMARSLSYMLMRGFSGDEIKRFEMFLAKRLSGEIDTPTFIDFLDSPYKEGGVGLWKQRATAIAKTAEDIVEKRKTVEDVYTDLQKDPETPLYEEVSKMRSWLLEDYKGILSDIQIVRFDEAVEDRFRNIISPENFRQVLELSRSDFGVGLAPGTVRTISEKLETILTGKNLQVFH